MSSLLIQRRFAPLFLTQFFSAFNDNFLKNALVFLILYEMEGSSGQSMVTLAGAILILPFFFLSGIGGELADRFDKGVVARRLKLAEFGASAIAVAGFMLHSLPILFAALFLFGVIAALFGPLKYGILPDHLKTEELPQGNALIEGATFLAVLLGTMAGGYAVQGGKDPASASLGMLILAALCYGSSYFIPRTGQAAPDLKLNFNLFTSTGSLLKLLWQDARLWRTGVMSSIFWMVGAVVLSLLPPLVKSWMGGEELVVSVYLAVFAVSIAIGSGIGSFLSSGRIVLLPAPVAMIFMGLWSLDLAYLVGHLEAAPASHSISAFFSSWASWHVAIDLSGLAIAGGIFIVPTFAALQAWAPSEHRARIIGAVNVLNAAFIVGGAVAIGALQAAGMGLGMVFAVLGLACLTSSIWIFKILPTNPLRDMISIILRTFYRTEITGLENIAKAGQNAIIALNHVSFLDAALALSMLNNDPVFAIDSDIAKRWWVKPFLKLTRAMPLDPTRPLATRTLINAVQSGETLVIFPEGRLTVTGSLMKVYDGAGLIAEKSGAKVVPVRIEGFEATIFSRLNRLQIRRRWFPKVRVTIMPAVELKVDAALRGKARRQASGAALYQIMSDLIFNTTPIDRTIFEATVEAARLHGKNRIALQDPIAGTMTYKRLLIGARVLGLKLESCAKAGHAVGVMLPNSNGVAATVLGLISANRVPAMINFSAGTANILACCEGSQIKTIVTARSFIEKAKLQPLVEQLAASVHFIYLEDVRAQVSLRDKISALFNYEHAILPAKADGRAAILFTSGSEGTPKGVVLSHKNMLANTAQAAARIDFGRQDRVFNVLPVFHSFGLTVGLVLPLVSGVPVYLYPSPLHYRIVPELVYSTNATILFGTDTFLNGYARSAHPYDFHAIRYILAGAEPVKDTTRRLYMEKFGVRILEGYGVTETAPVLAINTPMFNRIGTVGRIMPGMETRLETVDGVEDGGRLHVRGPNVMLGYLRAENPGILEPPVDGWHDTGDIVSLDKDHFITIKGRAKRFAKVGGEMISLAQIEAIASECWAGAMSAVASIPDAKKGERLILITDKTDATRSQFQTFAKTKSLSELAIPAQVLIVSALPLLGSGKLDFANITKLALEKAGAVPVAA
eukprot:gene17627-17830_t